MKSAIVITGAASAELEPTPIAPGWVLEGMPEAKAKLLSLSQDKTSRIMAWECTPGVFNWHYTEDETVYIVSGEVFISTHDGEECRLGPGDIALFPGGSSCTWRVTQHVRKVAVLRKDMPRALSLGVRAWHKFSRRRRAGYSAATWPGA